MSRRGRFQGNSMTIRRLVLLLAVSAGLLVSPMWGQGPAPKSVPTRAERLADQWPNYQNNSNFSPLTQITPQNVSKLAQAWTFHYGGGSLPEFPFVGLDNRFEVQPPNKERLALVFNGVSTVTPLVFRCCVR